MKLPILFTLSLLISCSVFGQSAVTDSVPYLRRGDTLTAYMHEIGELMFTHTVQHGQTLFSLAKFYGLTTTELYSYNPSLKSQYSPGTEVMIPLPLKALIRDMPTPGMRPNLVPVMYRVKKGETLFGIATRHFETTEAWLLARNPFLAQGVQPDQVLHVGWVTLDGFLPEWREIKGGYYAKINHPMKLEYFRRSEGKRVTEERGAATWPKNAPDQPGFFCLHRTAPINSYVEVHNPHSRKTIYLKVSARLPEGVYDQAIKVVVSPLAAKALGVKDDRFYMRLKHY